MRLALHRVLPPGERENPFDFLFGMGNISPTNFCPQTVASCWETREKSVHSIPAVGRRGRRIDFCGIDSIQQSAGRPRECVAPCLGPCCLQVRFQPLRALTVETVFIVIPFGVERRWTHVVLSAVGMSSHCSRDGVSPLQPAFAPRGVSCGHVLPSRCEEYRRSRRSGGKWALSFSTEQCVTISTSGSSCSAGRP